MAAKLENPILSPKFAEALQFANEIHATQARKAKPGLAGGAGVPYVSHLLGVCSLVLEYGGNEQQAIAALLHDAAEDCGGRTMLEQVRSRFGEEVAVIVEACTDSFSENPGAKEDWLPRKMAYLQRLEVEPAGAKLVSCADKLHNISNTLRDITAEGSAAWIARMSNSTNGTPMKQCCYYAACLHALGKGWQGPILGEFSRQVDLLVSLIGEPDWRSLEVVARHQVTQ